MKIYDSLNRKKIEFHPLNNNLIKFYQCGPTLYSYQHIGNLRSVVLSDLMIRTFQYLNYEIEFVRNYTDVGHLTSDSDDGDDKINKQAFREKLSPKEIVFKYQKKFENDIQKLNIRSIAQNPKASDYIKEMQEIIQGLLKKNVAYSTDLAIYFDTSQVNNYDCFSRGEKLKINLKNNKIQDNNKKQSTDFALWFFKAGTHQNALQFWDSPFYSPLINNGQGFPGWHIECSAMALSILGKQIDIKMGGIEHKQIHHTNEKAQSEIYNQKTYAQFWLHNEHLSLNGEKISKSNQKTILLSDLENKKFEALELRHFFLQSHYRTPQKFSFETLKASQKALEKIKNKIKIIQLNTDRNKSDENEILALKNDFEKSIKDDFNIPSSLSVFNTTLKSKKINHSDKLKLLKKFDNVLGLNLF